MKNTTDTFTDFFGLCDSYLKLEASSRRQLETLYKLRETSDITLDTILSATPDEKTLLICSDGIKIDWNGWIDINDSGFRPIDWTVFGDQ